MLRIEETSNSFFIMWHIHVNNGRCILGNHEYDIVMISHFKTQLQYLSVLDHRTILFQ